MKIGLDIRMYGTQHGGIGRYSKELFLRVLAMNADNQYFLFYNKTLDGSDFNQLKRFGNATLVESDFRHYSFAEQTSFLKLLNKFSLDLMHFPNFNVPVLYKRPFVVTIHDMVHHKIGGAKKSHLLHFLAYKKIIASAAQRAGQIITVSEYSKKDIATFLRVDPEKIRVIYEGIPLPRQAQAADIAEVKKRYALNDPYFLFVGVLERKKNLVNLTRGFDYFVQKYKAKMDLVAVGKTDRHYPEIKHKALDIVNSNRLVFTGHVEEDELAALYAGAYAFVSASLHEGFGLPGAEAMAYGLPLLVSNVEVFNEIYDNAAIYFNPLDPQDIAEKMNLLVRDPEFYGQLQSKSQERSKIFDWDRAAKETLAAYQSVYGKADSGIGRL